MGRAVRIRPVVDHPAKVEHPVLDLQQARIVRHGVVPIGSAALAELPLGAVQLRAGEIVLPNQHPSHRRGIRGRHRGGARLVIRAREGTGNPAEADDPEKQPSQSRLHSCSPSNGQQTIWARPAPYSHHRTGRKWCRCRSSCVQRKEVCDRILQPKGSRLFEMSRPQHQCAESLWTEAPRGCLCPKERRRRCSCRSAGVGRQFFGPIEEHLARSKMTCTSSPHASGETESSRAPWR